jgi:tRNA pseudouridine38-40 synthase
MNDAAQHLIGSHDFSSFCRRPVVPEGKLPVSLVREVYGARWVALDSSRMRFEIVASSFCHQMVRSTVGTLVDVGKGRRSADELPRILERRDRSGASPIAPPEGLCLWEVGYGGDPLAGSI